MNITRVLANVGGLVGLSMALICSAEPPPAPPAAPTPPAAPSTPAPTAPAVPAKDAAPATPPRVMSKQAAELLEKAAAAAKAVNDLSATVESGNGEKTSKGKVVFTLQDGQIPFANWRIEPTPAGTGAAGATAAYDGKTVRILKPTKKQMTELASPQFGMPSGDAGSLIPMWFMDQRQDRLGGMNLQVVEQVIEDETGTQKVGDEKVTVVRQVRETKLSAEQGGGVERTITETVRVALGSDNLARRYEQTIEVTGENGQKQVTKQTYGDLKVNTSPAAESFTLKAPEGYKTRTLDPSGPNLSVEEGDPAIDFTLKDAAGKEYKLADFKGKVVLLDFWATWCGPCKAAMPSIQKLHEAFKDKPVVIIGVNTWDKDEKVGPAYMAKEKFTYLALLKGDALATEYEITGIPTLLLIDKEGKIAHIGVGFGQNEEEHLTKLIEEKLK